MCCVVRPTAAFELGLNRATWSLLFGIFYVSVFAERLWGLDISRSLSVWCWSWGDKSFYSCKSSLKSSLAYVTTSLLVSSAKRRRPIPLLILQNIVRWLKRKVEFTTLIKLSFRYSMGEKLKTHFEGSRQKWLCKTLNVLCMILI